MEKNLLPIGVMNSRPNLDVSGYGNKDTFFTNYFFEVYEDAQTETQKVFAVKRPGFSPTATTSFGTNTTGFGCFAAQPYTSTNIFYAKQQLGVLTSIVHYNGVNSQFITNIVLSPLNRINFTNIGLPDDTYTTAFVSGPTLWLFKDRTAFTSVTPDGGSADLTRAVYLNNRVFVGNRVSAQIFQSGLGNYTTYSASEFITAEAYGGKLVDLARYNNYIVAFKEYSTEFFEDVANENGSVLGRVGQAVQQIGCVHPNTIVDTGSGELFWLGTDEGGQRSVVRLNNSFNAEQIHTEAIGKYLNLTTNYDGSYAFLLNANGHQFYVLTLKQNYNDSTNSTDICNVTFVYDLKTKLWSHWFTYGENTSFTAGGVNYATFGRWNVTGACRTASNTTLVQDYDTGDIYQLDDYYAYDNAAPIIAIMRFGNLDLGTFKRKFLNRLTVYCDGANETQQFTVTLSRSDTTGSASSYTTTAYPHSIFALGSYKRFTLEIGHYLATKLRVSAINLDFDIGEGHGIS